MYKNRDGKRDSKQNMKINLFVLPWRRWDEITDGEVMYLVIYYYYYFRASVGCYDAFAVVAIVVKYFVQIYGWYADCGGQRDCVSVYLI